MCCDIAVSARVCITLDYSQLHPAVKALHCYIHLCHQQWPGMFVYSDLTNRFALQMEERCWIRVFLLSALIKAKQKKYLRAAPYVVLNLQSYRWSKIVLPVRKPITFRHLFLPELGLQLYFSLNNLRLFFFPSPPFCYFSPYCSPSFMFVGCRD